MNITLKRKVAIASIVATSLLSVVSPASAASPISSTPKQLIAFTIPKQQLEASVNKGVLQVAIPASFLESSIDSIVSGNQGRYKDTDDRRQLLVKQRHRDHEMFIVHRADCRFMRYTRIWSLDRHSAPSNRHIRCSLG
jgi:hypothetical protein